MEIIVTDVTEFHNQNIYCVAGICKDGLCYRPTSNYFSVAECRQLNIMPGAVLEGDFDFLNADCPHCEDCSRTDVQFLRNCTPHEFKTVLQHDLSASVESGFNCDLSEDRKLIPIDSPPERSIITVRANPRRCWLNQDNNNPLRPRFSFYEMLNDYYPYLPVGDIKIREYFLRCPTEETMNRLTDFVRGQEELYLRIGIGRAYERDGRNGHWLQVNGIYTFPEWIPGTRGLQVD